jgi:hypothetical protein
MLEFKSGADNATRRGRGWRLFGAYRFENQATRSGITYNALAPKPRYAGFSLAAHHCPIPSVKAIR